MWKALGIQQLHRLPQQLKELHQAPHQPEHIHQLQQFHQVPHQSQHIPQLHDCKQTCIYLWASWANIALTTLRTNVQKQRRLPLHIPSNEKIVYINLILNK